MKIWNRGDLVEVEDLARGVCRHVGRVMDFPWQKGEKLDPAEAALAAVKALSEHVDALETAMSHDAMEWFPMSEAKRDGTAYLVYGRHTEDSPPGAQKGVEKGDHFWAIALFDVWRDAAHGGQEWVFAISGKPLWGKPLKFAYLMIPQEVGDEGRDQAA